MQAYSTASERSSMSHATEALLRPLFVSLPTPRGIDAESLMDGYLIALEGVDRSALSRVVLMLVKGTWHEEVKFCPRPPELANMVRAEQRRMDAMMRPKVLAFPAPLARPWVDWREVQRNRMRDERRAFIEHATLGQFKSNCLRKKYPAGSTWYWALGAADTMLGTVAGPVGSAA